VHDLVAGVDGLLGDRPYLDARRQRGPRDEQVRAGRGRVAARVAERLQRRVVIVVRLLVAGGRRCRWDDRAPR